MGRRATVGSKRVCAVYVIVLAACRAPAAPPAEVGAPDEAHPVLGDSEENQAPATAVEAGPTDHERRDRADAAHENRGPEAERAPPAPTSEPDDPCTRNCLANNQMRAVAWEQILRDCAAECRSETQQPQADAR